MRHGTWFAGHDGTGDDGDGSPSPDPDANALIVWRLRGGDDAALVFLVDSWSPVMLRLARRYVSSAQSAEDIVQDTWLSVLDGLHCFEQRSSLRTWVFRILVNKAKSCGAREHRTLSWTVAFAGGSGTMADPDSFRGDDDGGSVGRCVPRRRPETPEGEVLAREVRKVISDAVERLPARQRAVFELRDVHGLSADEVCGLLRLSAANQRVLLHRARAVVRARVGEYLNSTAA